MSERDSSGRDCERSAVLSSQEGRVEEESGGGVDMLNAVLDRLEKERGGSVRGGSVHGGGGHQGDGGVGELQREGDGGVGVVGGDALWRDQGFEEGEGVLDVDVVYPNGRPTHEVEAMFQPVGVDRGGPYRGGDTLDPELVAALKRYAVPVSRYFRTSVRGLEKLPRNTGCMCVGNHSLLGVDSVSLFTEVYMNTGRLFRGLGAHTLFQVPYLGSMLERLGSVDGTRENALEILQQGHWAICYPGGVRESMKSAQEKYRLKWEGRVGYLRCALAAGVPVVPIAGVGIDDAFVVVGKERWLGKRLFGKGHNIPIFFGLGAVPLPVRFTFIIGEPIDLIDLGLNPAYADAPLEVLRPVHHMIWRRLDGMIQEGLRGRVNAFL